MPHMEEDLIAKKDLLARYNISYGALYRWKRMGLIPESWFLRRSTPTGQETFFRRDTICARIELILQEKEGQSLEELALSLQAGQRIEHARRTLTIRTRFGTKTYPISEIEELWLTQGESKIDLLDKLKEEL